MFFVKDLIPEFDVLIAGGPQCGQPEFEPLPFTITDEGVGVTFALELTPDEIERVKTGGRIYITTMTHGTVVPIRVQLLDKQMYTQQEAMIAHFSVPKQVCERLKTKKIIV